MLYYVFRGWVENSKPGWRDTLAVKDRILNKTPKTLQAW